MSEYAGAVVDCHGQNKTLMLQYTVT